MDSRPVTPHDAQPAPVSIEAAKTARASRRLQRSSGGDAPAPNAAEAGAAQVAAERRDAIDFSTAARRLAELKARGGTDAERRELLATLRAEVDAGRYRLDPDGIARMMLERGEV